jgi:aryl carrier-like protein
MSSPIFLSSTYSDLLEHRRAVLHVLQRMRTLIEAMEYFGSDSEIPLDVCLSAVERCDLYIGIFGMRYGFTDTSGVSLTQREYEKAFEKQKTIHIYLLDEERHLVAPVNVEQGVGSLRLQELKAKLRQRHVCVKFDSAADLAGKVALDLVRHLKPNEEVSAKVEMLIGQLPTLRLNTGYGIGLRPLSISAKSALAAGGDGVAQLSDPYVQQAASAAAIASALVRSDFSILKGLLTFDKGELNLVIALLQVWGVDQSGFASAIRATNDPMKFRILTAIAGRLGLVETAEAICDAMLNRYAMHCQFKQMGQMATPVRDVARLALTSMGEQILPVVQKYGARAKELRRWQQKQLFESVVHELTSTTRK